MARLKDLLQAVEDERWTRTTTHVSQLKPGDLLVCPDKLIREVVRVFTPEQVEDILRIGSARGLDLSGLYDAPCYSVICRPPQSEAVTLHQSVNLRPDVTVEVQIGR